MRLAQTFEDKLGEKHYRFDQYYKGIKVEEAQFILHKKNGFIRTANGKLVHGLSISINPRLTENTALSNATRHIGAEIYMWQKKSNEEFIKQEQKNSSATFYPQGQLKLTCGKDELLSKNFKLVYRFDIYAEKPQGRYFVDVDAQNGEIVNKIADNHNLIVMIHPDYGQQSAIEQILKVNPNVKFLFHGHEMEPWVIYILDKYQNAYYSVDTSLFGIPNELIANLYGPEKEEFVSELTGNFNKILDTNLGKWKPRIEKYPDKFLWGTDRAFAWHFDSEVGVLLEEMSRSFIGQLNPEVQEKFAYKNAERLLQER